MQEGWPRRPRNLGSALGHVLRHNFTREENRMCPGFRGVQRPDTGRCHSCVQTGLVQGSPRGAPIKGSWEAAADRTRPVHIDQSTQQCPGPAIGCLLLFSTPHRALWSCPQKLGELDVEGLASLSGTQTGTHPPCSRPSRTSSSRDLNPFSEHQTLMQPCEAQGLLGGGSTRAAPPSGQDPSHPLEDVLIQTGLGGEFISSLLTCPPQRASPPPQHTGARPSGGEFD